MIFDSLEDLFYYAKRNRYLLNDEWEESKHPRGQPGNAGQFTESVPQLSDKIETILHGTRKEKEKLKGKYFELSKTPAEFKNVGLKGDNITTKYGTISRHKGKNKEHKFSSDEWRAICRNLSDPKKCVITQNPEQTDFNIYTKLGDTVMVGVKVNTYDDKIYNNLRTIYKRLPRSNEDVLYPKGSQSITPVQRSILAELNSSTYTADGCYTIMLDQRPELVKLICTLFDTAGL